MSFLPFQTDLTYTNQLGTSKCAVEPQQPLLTGELLTSGCPAAAAELGEQLGARNIERIYEALGFFSTPNLPLEIAASQVVSVQDASIAAVGQEDLLVTPLQMAIAAATLTNQGKRPEPQIISAVLTTNQGWVSFPSQPATETILAAGIDKVLDAITIETTQTWETTAVIRNDQTSLTWYLGGSLPGATSKNYALAVILEAESSAVSQTDWPNSAADSTGKIISGANQQSE